MNLSKSYSEIADKIPISIFIFIFFICSISVITYNNYREEAKNIIDVRLKEQKAISDLKVREIENWLHERKDDALLFFNNENFSKVVTGFLNKPRNLTNKSVLLQRIVPMSHNQDYENILLVDLSGNSLLSVSGKDELLSDAEKQILAKRSYSNNVNFSDLYRRNDGSIRLNLIVPIFKNSRRTGKPSCFIFFRINPDVSLYPLIHSWPTLSKTSETLLVEKCRDSDSIVFLNELKHLKNTALKLKRSIKDTIHPSVKAVLGKEGAFEGIDYRGKSVLATSKKIFETPWYMITKTDMDEINAPIKEKMNFFILFIGVLVILTTTFIWAALNRRKVKYYKNLIEIKTGKEIAEANLRSEHSLLSSLINSPHEIIIFSLDKNYCYTSFNEKHQIEMKKVWNTDIQTGMNILECIKISELKNLAKQSIDRALSGESFSEIQHQPEPDIYYEFTWSPILHDNEIKGVTIFIIDITKRKYAEQELIDSEEKFRTIFENSSSAMAIIERDTTISMVNKEYCKLSLYEEKDVIGTSWTRQIPSEDLERLKEYNRKRLIDPKSAPDHYEFMFYRKDGTIRHCLISVAIIPTSKKIVCSFIDISDRKNAESSLSTLAHRQEALLSAIPDIIMEVDNNMVYKWANQPGINFFGDDVIGKPADFYFENQQDTFDKVKPLFSGSDDVIFLESLQRRKDGEKRLLEWCCRGLKDSNGKVTGALSTARDITEYKQNEEKIIILNADLERRIEERTYQLINANKELEAFSYTVSHDLRAPLRAIDGFSRIIMEDYEKLFDKEGHRLFGVIRSNIVQMNQLINDILSLSRTSKVDIQFTKVKMAELVESSFLEVVNNDQKQKIDFTVSALPDALCDRSLIHQVWVNLLSNSVKFIRPVDNPKIVIGGKIENDFCIYFIKDNGVGYDSEYSHKLFGVFQRLHKSEDFEGTGIGLAIVQRIVNRHGGKVWSESKINKGATFYFSLPAIS